MERSKTIFLSKIAIAILMFIFIDKTVVRILIAIFVAFDGFKDTMFFVIIILLVFLSDNYRKDFIPIGVVDKVTSKTVLVEKGLYRVRLYDNNYENGDILFFTGANRLKDTDENRNNVLFKSDIHYQKIGSLRLRKWALNRISDFDHDTGSAFKKILLNDYVEADLNFGYGFYFYYVLLWVSLKNHKASLIICLFYTMLFGFELKLLLFFIGYVIDRFEFDRTEKLSLRAIIIAICNYHLFTNYSFLIGFVFSLMSLMGQRKGSLLFIVVESWFFKRVSIFHLLALKVMIVMRMFSFILCLITFFLPVVRPLFLFYLKIQSFILSFDSLAIRGEPDLLILMLLILMIAILKIRNEYLKTVLYCILLLMPLNQIFPAVSFIDVGQGDAILISGSFGRYNILIDTGSPFNYGKLQNYLFSKGVYHLDSLIITHDDADHSGNIAAIKDDFSVGEIVLEKRDVVVDDIYLRNIDSGSYDNKNADSLVYYLDYHDLAFLFTGDITSKTEMNILSMKLIDDVDVLKVSHHGSDTATSDLFVSRVLPRFAVISTSGMYDHPKKEVIATLNNYCVRTFITKDDGTVRFVFTPIRNFVKTEYGNFVIID